MAVSINVKEINKNNKQIFVEKLAERTASGKQMLDKVKSLIAQAKKATEDGNAEHDRLMVEAEESIEKFSRISREFERKYQREFEELGAFFSEKW